jgi:hypothetical protein
LPGLKKKPAKPTTMLASRALLEAYFGSAIAGRKGEPVRMAL